VRKILAAVLVVSALTLLFAAAANAGTIRQPDDGEELVPTGKGWGEVPGPDGKGHNGAGQAGKTGSAKVGSNGIFYHGGPVILGTTNMYYIWYGNWTGNTATSILQDFSAGIGGSSYYNINTTYYDGANRHVTNAVHKVDATSTTTDNYSHGTALSDADVQSIVTSAISSGRLPTDANGVYFVLTSADVNETSGFCTQYCGWHTRATINGADIKYSFVGNPDRCPSACAAQTIGPNGNAGADAMASIIAHELEEAVTDPDLNAWYDTRGRENADKCAWTFGSTYIVNGAHANMPLGGREFLIQQNWVNASGGFCAKSY